MDKYCISKDYTIKEAIEHIDRNRDRVAIVRNLEKKVIGVVSQGDIIRALISGKSLYTRVERILRSNFLYLNENDIEEAYKLFRKIKITLLPIVDDEFYLTGIINMDNIYQYMEEKCKN